MKTCLITGGCGFIGSTLINRLLGRGGIKVINLDLLTYAGDIDNLGEAESDPNYVFAQADIVDTETVESIFESYDIDAVINFAAETHLDRSVKNPVIFGRTNSIGALNVLNVAKRAWEGKGGFKKGAVFIQISTDEVYGALGPTGLFLEGSSIDPRSPYSASKASADVFVQAYGSTYRMPVVIARCSSCYGPKQHREKLVPSLALSALDRKPVQVYGEGLQSRDWIYVDDLCEAIEAIMDSGKANEIYNIGANAEISYKDLVYFIIGRVRPGEENDLVLHSPERRGYWRRFAVDTSKIAKELGWTAKTPFSDGFDRTLEWLERSRHRI
ncbi:MAG: dTDP-glucose 4,6-dehydratase [Clostridiales bacterium]|nr:dTDP-glucose 4,6-dehydratase [Clostridiales bacterium]